jgi:hypothetical protein
MFDHSLTLAASPGSEFDIIAGECRFVWFSTQIWARLFSLGAENVENLHIWRRETRIAPRKAESGCGGQCYKRRVTPGTSAGRANL